MALNLLRSISEEMKRTPYVSLEAQENLKIVSNLSKLKRTISNIQKPETSRISIWKIRRWYSDIQLSHKIAFASLLFTCIAMISAILIVCFTLPQRTISCQSSFKAIINYTNYEHDAHPCSIVTGHFNHDHFLDIVVVNSGTNYISVFLNYGNNSFAPQVKFTTGDYSTPVSVAVGRFNNDEHLDIAVTNYDAHNIGIFLGYGNGTFRNQTTLPTNAFRPISIAIGDLNNDYCNDIVITNNGTNITIFFGYGNGVFKDPITYCTGYDSFPYSVAVAHLNNDRNLDIVVANYGANNIGIFFGSGNGSFADQITYSTGLQSRPYSIAINDINDDGYSDIAVANSGTNTIGLFLGIGYGKFVPQTPKSIAPGINPRSIIIGDFNRDNQFDIAVSNSDTDNLSIIIGYNNGSFAEPTFHSTGVNSGPFGIAVGDFDNNNQSDIAVANLDTNKVLVLIGYCMMQSDTPTTYQTEPGSLPYQIYSGDFDNDSNLDLAVIYYGTNDVGVFLGFGNGSFQNQITYSTGNKSRPLALTIIDLDNDHYLDIVVANSNSECIGILYGYGDGTFANVVTHFTGDSSYLYWITVDDFNNDAHLDIVFVDYNTDSIGIFLGYGNRTFKNVTRYSMEGNLRPCSSAAGDFNNDTRLDLAILNYGTNNVAILLGNGDGTFILFSTYSTGLGSTPWMLTTADLDKDGRLDIIVANAGTIKISVFFGLGNGTFHVQEAYSTVLSSSHFWVSVVDMNNDGWLDLIVVNSDFNNIGVLLGNSNGYFDNETTYSTGSASSPQSIAVGDFNKDDRLDIAVANYGTNNVAILLGHPTNTSASQRINNKNPISTNVPILLGNYYANFSSQTSYLTSASLRPYSIAIGDLNNDTHMDLVVANSGNESLGLFLGYDNGTFDKEIFYSMGAGYVPQHIIIYDFNKDNQLDIVVSNPTNDKIKVLLGKKNNVSFSEIKYSLDSGSRPTGLAMGDFNEDTYQDLIVINEGINSIGIFFGYNYIYFTMQPPCKSGDMSLPYAVATGDFNNDGNVDFVSALHGTNNVGVFLGFGNGRFMPVMYYGDVPSSHPWSIAVGYFDNNDQLDIVVASWGINSISILLGHGNGSFTDPVLYKTGPGTRPTSIAVGHFNNDDYLDIITANYGTNTIGVFFGNGDGTFQNVTTLPTGKDSRPKSINVFDINNDTYSDIIIANSGDNNVGIVYSYGNGSFAEQLTFSSGADSSPEYVTAGDFNKDGKLDLAVANYGKSNVGILFGFDNGSFGDLHMYTTGNGSNPSGLKVADFNNDNYLDIVVVDETNKKVGVFFGYNDGTFASISLVSLEEGSSVLGVDVGDFNNDNYTDIVVANTGNTDINVFLSDGSKPFGGQEIYAIGPDSQPSAVAVGHFNNDTLLDIAVSNLKTNNIGILINQGNRKFSNLTTYYMGNNSQPMALATGDFNNDSFTDIVVANSESNNIVLLIGNGHGNFSIFLTYPMGDYSRPVSIAMGDFNRDYQLDIAVANYGTNNVCILSGSGNETSLEEKQYPLGYGSRPSWILFEDLNNDGWEDIAVATYSTDNIKILLNMCQKTPVFL